MSGRSFAEPGLQAMRGDAVKSAEQEGGESAHNGTGDGKWTLREIARLVAITVSIALFLKFFIIEAYMIPTASMEDTLYPGDYVLVNKFLYGAKTPRYVAFLDSPLPQVTLPALRKPARGDVLVFESPVWRTDRSATMMNLVKRCIGLPGDTVRIRNGLVSVNGMTIHAPETGKRGKYVPPPSADPRIYPGGAPFNADEYGPVVVPRTGQTIILSDANVDEWRDLIVREGHTVASRGHSVLIDGREADSYTVEHDYYFVLGDNRRDSMDSRYWGFLPAPLIIGQAMLVYWSSDPSPTKSSFPENIRWDRIGMVIR